MVEFGAGDCARHQPAHRAAGARLACGSRQGAVVWPRAGPPLDDTASAGIHDDFVTPRSSAELTNSGSMKRSAAEIVREYGPFPGVDQVHGVTYDGQQVWFASGDKLNAFDPASGRRVRSIDVAAHAGTAFDGQHLFQIAEDRIQKIDPKTGEVLATIPAPGGGGDSGLAWAEGTLWVGNYRGRKIHQIDPENGAILRTIESNRFVTGVTWVDGDLWHATGKATRAI